MDVVSRPLNAIYVLQLGICKEKAGRNEVLSREKCILWVGNSWLRQELKARSALGDFELLLIHISVNIFV